MSYQGLPSSDDAGVYRQYSLEYWLAPARQWQSFGTLTVDVWVPPHWETQLEPALTLIEPDHWQETFEGLPSDVLTVNSRPVVAPLVRFLRSLLPITGVAIAFVTTFWVYRWLGRISQRQDWSGGWLVLTFLLIIPLSIPIFWGLGGLGLWAAESFLNGSHLGVGYRYSRTILFALGGAIAIPTGLVVAIFSFVLGRVNRRKRQQMAEEQ